MPEKDSPRPRCRQRGFTVVELILTCALMSTLLLGVYAVMDMARVLFNTDNAYSQFTQENMQTLRSISREIGQTSPFVTPSHLNITADGNGNSSVRFQIPVDWDSDGDATSGTLNPIVEWGAYDRIGDTASGRLNGWIRYSVVNGQLVRGILDQNLAAVQGLDQIVANNVQTFTVSRVGNRVRMTLLVSVNDPVGQAGAARVQQKTFVSDTFLRNAVN